VNGFWSTLSTADLPAESRSADAPGRRRPVNMRTPGEAAYARAPRIHA